MSHLEYGNSYVKMYQIVYVKSIICINSYLKALKNKLGRIISRNWSMCGNGGNIRCMWISEDNFHISLCLPSFFEKGSLYYFSTAIACLSHELLRISLSLPAMSLWNTGISSVGTVHSAFPWCLGM